jgi:hypothetical protein
MKKMCEEGISQRTHKPFINEEHLILLACFFRIIPTTGSSPMRGLTQSLTLIRFIFG